MGYQTNYSLSSIPHVDNNIIADQLEVISDYSFDNYGGEVCVEGKWYDHEDHMKKLSLMYPEVLFTLHGEGEEDEDKWNKYFMNGKMQHCHAEITIIYPEFDAAKLA